MKKIIQVTINLGMCVYLVAASTGCSAFRGQMQTVSITCEPADATILVNGHKYSSPAQVSVKRNKDVSINCYKDGYNPYQQAIGYHFNSTGVLDVVGTALFIVPCIGLCTPGAWSLDETDVNVTMIQK